MGDPRLDAFREDIAAMRIKDPVVGREILLLRAGAVLMVVGVGIAVAAYFLSHSTFSVADQNDDQVIVICGLAVTVLGAALFLRYSLAAFLRFWLARLIYEQHRINEQQRATTTEATDTVEN